MNTKFIKRILKMIFHLKFVPRNSILETDRRKSLCLLFSIRIILIIKTHNRKTVCWLGFFCIRKRIKKEKNPSNRPKRQVGGVFCFYWGVAQLAVSIGPLTRRSWFQIPPPQPNLLGVQLSWLEHQTLILSVVGSNPSTPAKTL